MLKVIKNSLHKKKRKIYNYSKQLFQKTLWEKNIDNLYYGHYYIFKRYTNSILPYKINGELQHGWSNDHGIAFNPEKNIKHKNLRFYLWNENNLFNSLHYGYKNAVVIGAPFIYLPKSYTKENEFSSKSLIVFPLHSDEYDYFDINTGYNIFLNNIKKIFPFFNSITVSLAWRDFQDKNLVKLFSKEGFKVITMGHRDNNPNFLPNFVNIVNEHEYVCSDTFSSAIFYSLLMKKKVFIYGGSMSKYVDVKETWEGRNDYNHDKYSNLYPELLWENFDDKSHHAIGEKELGLDYKKSPKEICEIFDWRYQNIIKLFT